MPSRRGGVPRIMAYPGVHPRAYLDVCVREIRGRVGRISLPRFENGAGCGPTLAGTGKWNPCLRMASAVAISPHPAPRAMGRFPRCDRPCGHVLPVVNCPVSRLSNVPTCGPMLIGWAQSLTAVLWAPRCEPEGPGASLPSRPHGLATCPSASPHEPEDHQCAPLGRPRTRRPGDCPA